MKGGGPWSSALCDSTSAQPARVCAAETAAAVARRRREVEGGVEASAAMTTTWTTSDPRPSITSTTRETPLGEFWGMEGGWGRCRRARSRWGQNRRKWEKQGGKKNDKKPRRLRARKFRLETVDHPGLNLEKGGIAAAACFRVAARPFDSRTSSL